jgi:hypothetical protein
LYLYLHVHLKSEFLGLSLKDRVPASAFAAGC